MSIFELEELQIVGAKTKVFVLVENGKNRYEQFRSKIAKELKLGDDDSKWNKNNPLLEIDAVFEDLALENMVLPRLNKKIANISKRIDFTAYEVSSKKDMLRVYYVKEKNTGNLIILGHKKGNKKDQNRTYNIVIDICNRYSAFKRKTKPK